MTTQKTFKRRVRARAAKTGEAYSAARAQLLRKTDPPPAAAQPDPSPPDTMALTGMTAEAFVRGTGKPIGEWLDRIDAWGGTEHTHAEIARWVVTEHEIGGWWAQSVTVAYERARGMRAMYERPSGFEVTVSKTIAAPAERITDAFTDTGTRDRWQPDAPIRVRTAHRGRSARFDWDDPPSRIAINVTANPAGKHVVAVQHERLPDAATSDRLRAMWRDRLSEVKRLLEEG